MPGLFVSFEGVEGSGKSTQISLVEEALCGLDRGVYVTREPGGSALAERIRELILTTYDDPPVARAELLLMLAARAQHVDRVIRPRLEAGEVVLCDRFYDSTVAYQGFARGLDLPTLRFCNEFAIDGVRPDVTIVLDMPPEEGLSRQIHRNRMEAEALEFHQAVRRGFQEQARREPERVRLIDARGPIPHVHQSIMQELTPALQAL